MPFKHNAVRRHRVPKVRYRVTNWPSYDAGLRRHGDVFFWLDKAALAGWQAPRRTTPGGQPRYSELAIELMLTLRLVFHLALRQAEAFAASLLRLLGLELSIPDHTTLSRCGRRFAGRQPRVACRDGPHAEKHGRARRRWHKLHLGVNAGTGEIAAHVLTDGNADDATQATALLKQAEGILASVTADGAYDSEPVYRAAASRQRDPPPDVIIPPRASAVPSNGNIRNQSLRDRRIRLLAAKGRIGWQQATGYGRRNHPETAIGRYKRLSGRSCALERCRVSKARQKSLSQRSIA